MKIIIQDVYVELKFHLKNFQFGFFLIDFFQLTILIDQYVLKHNVSSFKLSEGNQNSESSSAEYIKIIESKLTINF